MSEYPKNAAGVFTPFSEGVSEALDEDGAVVEDNANEVLRDVEVRVWPTARPSPVVEVHISFFDDGTSADLIDLIRDQFNQGMCYPEEEIAALVKLKEGIDVLIGELQEVGKSWSKDHGIRPRRV